MRASLWLILFLVPASTAAQEKGDRLNLICSGGGAANKPGMSTFNAWNSSGDAASGSVMGMRSVGFDDQVSLWLEGDDGRIRMPRAMLPSIRGGENGWFKIKSIEVGENEIQASVAVSMLNNPKLRLDRITGAISISGKSGDYSGHCQPFEPENVKRAF